MSPPATQKLLKSRVCVIDHCVFVGKTPLRPCCCWPLRPYFISVRWQQLVNSLPKLKTFFVLSMDHVCVFYHWFLRAFFRLQCQTTKYVWTKPNQAFEQGPVLEGFDPRASSVCLCQHLIRRRGHLVVMVKCREIPAKMHVMNLSGNCQDSDFCSPFPLAFVGSSWKETFVSCVVTFR